jgi:metal-dependent amidase/aminoacylase/carboxypeptidase family protein
MATRYPSKSRIGNREFRTAALIVKHLESLGVDVQTKVGVTGVVLKEISLVPL